MQHVCDSCFVMANSVIWCTPFLSIYVIVACIRLFYFLKFLVILIILFLIFGRIWILWIVKYVKHIKYK